MRWRARRFAVAPWCAVVLCLLASAGRVDAQEPCRAAVAPVRALDFESRYDQADPSRATLDEDRAARARAAISETDAFIRALADDLDAVLTASGAAERRDGAACILSRLGDWARADALSAIDSRTARLTIGSRLAAFGIIASRAALLAPEAADLDAVGRWLAVRMGEQMRFWETAPERAAQNNLRAWAALAGAAIAGLTDDPVMRGWAAWSVAYVVCSAAPDGSLPREMSRGRRALHYQLHALSALVPAAAHLEAQGIPVRDRCDGALGRAVGFALDDLATGDRTRTITGAAQTMQDGTDPLEDFQLAFLESWIAMTGDPAAEARAAPRRPLSYSKLGGNQTLIWQR